MLKVFYLFFVIAISFGGNFHLGIVTPRQIAAVFMTLICAIHFSVIKNYINKYVFLYLFYLLFVAISSYYDNSIDKFLRNLVAQNFVAIACYGSIIYYYHKTHSFNVILYCLLFCGIINMVVCLLQYVGNPVGFQLGYMFIGADEVMANRHMEQLMDGTGSGYLLGMRGDAVHNGYFQMIMPFLLTYTYLRCSKKNMIYKAVFYILLLFLFVTILLIQERSCILFSLGVYGIFVYKNFKKVSSERKIATVFLIAIFALILYSYVYEIIDSYLQNSRFENRDDNLREALLNNTLTYIENNPLLGGMASFMRKTGFPPHNIFLNAFVEAGIFGFILSIIIYVGQLKTTKKIIGQPQTEMIAYTFIAYSLNSLLHNDSILSGDAIAWMLWGMIFAIYKKTLNRNIANNKTFKDNIYFQ